MGGQQSMLGGNVETQKRRKSSSRTVTKEFDSNVIEPGEMEESPDTNFKSGSIEVFRLWELMLALQQIARLQGDVSTTSVLARQKRREASFKRDHVWMSDARFMAEVQRLVGQGQLEKFEELSRLAALCQASRDDLGPLELEGVEVERELEGQIWELRQAETQLYSEFKQEFEVAGSHPALSTGTASSQYGHHSELVQDSEDDLDFEDEVDIPARSETRSQGSSSVPVLDPIHERNSNREKISSSSLLGVGGPNEHVPRSDTLDCDSGFGDIDEKADTRASDNPPLPLPSRDNHHGSIELYPHLLTDFKSRRERINKWLENYALSSHIEGVSLFTILKYKLESENYEVPSNWSQLVIAYWELDDAAVPQKRKVTASNNNPLDSVLASEDQENSHKTSLAEGYGMNIPEQSEPSHNRSSDGASAKIIKGARQSNSTQELSASPKGPDEIVSGPPLEHHPP